MHTNKEVNAGNKSALIMVKFRVTCLTGLMEKKSKKVKT